MSITRTTNEVRKSLARSLLKKAADLYKNMEGLGDLPNRYVPQTFPIPGPSAEYPSLGRPKNVAEIFLNMIRKREVRGLREESYRVMFVQAGSHLFRGHLVTEPYAISRDYHETRRRMTARGIPSELSPLMIGVDTTLDSGRRSRATLVIPPVIETSYHQYVTPNGKESWRFGVTSGNFRHPEIAHVLREIPIQVELMEPDEGDFFQTVAIYLPMGRTLVNNLDYLRHL